MATKEPPDEAMARPFAAILQDLDAGKVHNRLSDQLRDLTEAVMATGRKGTLQLTLTVAPIKPGNTANLVVTTKTAVKAPEGDEATPSSVFFTDAEGNLTRNDPRQPTLPLRGLDNPRSATA